MLSIYYGDMPEAIYNTSVYFKNTFRNEWLEDPLVIEMIKDVDNSDVLGNGAIKSPVLGVIAPNTLSGGVKTLILIYKQPERVFNASNCGDNCAKWLLTLGEMMDITINLRHLMNFGDGDYQIRVLNADIIVTNRKELIATAGSYM
ncbi:MAG: DUF4869 domain-containing protein [Lachnospiraceae bacterium]|nr:DUF4869 domain-containing protein [Lachnospiraceae bacterium]